jgi:sugar phosphate isomerase/epimerase
LRAELYFKLGWDKLSLAQHKEIAKTISGELPGLSIHLPYDGSGPKANNHDRESVAELQRCLDAVSAYNPEHLVAHAEFRGLADSAMGPRNYQGQQKGPLDNEFHQPSQEFLEESVAWWRRVLSASQAPLYLENTYEHSPFPICRVIELLGPQSGFCLDLGHWHHYAMGRHWENLGDWLRLVGPQLRHLHLHDNEGEADSHLGLGQGNLDIPMAWELLGKVYPHPTVTLENHRLEGLFQSLAYLQNCPLY